MIQEPTTPKAFLSDTLIFEPAVSQVPREKAAEFGKHEVCATCWQGHSTEADASALDRGAGSTLTVT